MDAKKRLWSFDRETEEAAVNRNATDAGLRELCYAVVDAVLQIRETGRVDKQHLDAFARTLECGSEYVFCHGGRRLVECAHLSQEAAQTLVALMQHRKWRVRFNTVAITDYEPPEGTLLAILRQGLRDKSKRVRALSLSKVLMRRISRMLPDLRDRLSAEPDPEVRQQVSDAVPLIEHGVLRKDGCTIEFATSLDGRAAIVYHFDNGHSYTISSGCRRRESSS